MTNWANKGKAALASVPAVPAGYTRLGNPGSGEEITTFYRFTPAPVGTPKAGVVTAGDKLEGTYAGSYENKKFGNTVHKLRTEAGLVALPNATALNNALKGVVEGTKLVIIYNGKNVIKTGKYAGKAAHSFDVFAA